MSALRADNHPLGLGVFRGGFAGHARHITYFSQRIVLPAISRLGRARHSVRAVPGHQVTRVGNRGGQRTARPTCGCAKVQFNLNSEIEVRVRVVGSARCADIARVLRTSGRGARTDARTILFRAGFSPVGIAALRRPRRRAQRQAPKNESHSECLIPVRSALPGGGIAARCPYLVWHSG